MKTKNAKKQKKTEIIIVLDRSGSMATIKDDMVGGLNAFIKNQRDLTIPCSVSLYQFDTDYEIVCENVPLADFADIALVPRGCTSLLDALGRTLARTRDKKTKKLVVVITDGHENSSREFNVQTVKKAIEKRRASGWEFIFLGADEAGKQEAQDV